ncbi:MAG: immunity 17 family protein [Ruminococcus sp.]|nr:immunity 17 family protein [Ruminococcus sp.]
MFQKIFAILAGVFCICASYYNWDWFFENMKAQPFVKLFGRDGARTFYTVLGAVLMILGFFIC